MNITFAPDPNRPNCLTYTTSGCGIWNGEAEINCGNIKGMVKFPTIEIPEDQCCEGEDCFGIGEGCDEDREIDISEYIVAYPLFGADNEHSLQIKVSENDPNSPVSFDDLWRLGDRLSDCWEQDGEFVEGGVYDSAFDEQSQIYAEAIINTDNLGGTTKTTFCFGKNCESGIGSCRAINGCTDIDICEDAAVILIDKRTGDLINGKTFSNLQAGDTIDVVAIFSIPNQVNSLNYQWTGVENGISWLSGPAQNNIGGAEISEGTIRVDQPGQTHNIGVSVQGICEAVGNFIIAGCVDSINPNASSEINCGLYNVSAEQLSLIHI